MTEYSYVTFATYPAETKDCNVYLMLSAMAPLPLVVLVPDFQYIGYLF